MAFPIMTAIEGAQMINKTGIPSDTVVAEAVAGVRLIDVAVADQILITKIGNVVDVDIAKDMMLTTPRAIAVLHLTMIVAMTDVIGIGLGQVASTKVIETETGIDERVHLIGIDLDLPITNVNETGLVVHLVAVLHLIKTIVVVTQNLLEYLLE